MRVTCLAVAPRHGYLSLLKSKMCESFCGLPAATCEKMQTRISIDQRLFVISLAGKLASTFLWHITVE